LGEGGNNGSNSAENKEYSVDGRYSDGYGDGSVVWRGFEDERGDEEGLSYLPHYRIPFPSPL